MDGPRPKIWAGIRPRFEAGFRHRKRSFFIPLSLRQVGQCLCFQCNVNLPNMRHTLMGNSGVRRGQPGFWGRQAVSNSKPKTTKFAWSIFFQKTPPLSNRARRGISPKLEDSPSRPMGSNSLAKFVSRLGFKSKPVGYRRKKILHDRNMNRKAENKSPPAPDFNIGWVVQKRYS